jgi:hypothetical protein
VPTSRPLARTADDRTYAYVGAFDLGDPLFGERRHELSSAVDFRREVAELEGEGYSWVPDQRPASCGHCGTHLRYVALIADEDRRGLLLIGDRCFMNVFWASDPHVNGLVDRELQTLRYHAARERKALKARMAFERQCEQQPALTWATYAANILRAEPVAYGTHALETLASIAHSAGRYGSATLSQVAYVTALVRQVEERAALYDQDGIVVLVERARRVLVEGLVHSFGEREHRLGRRRWFEPRVTIERDDGALLVGTPPPTLYQGQVEIDDRVRFIADTAPWPGDPLRGYLDGITRVEVLARRPMSATRPRTEE